MRKLIAPVGQNSSVTEYINSFATGACLGARISGTSLAQCGAFPWSAKKAGGRSFACSNWRSLDQIGKLQRSLGQKYLSPRGTTRWTNSQVRGIWSNPIYIGVINYRKTNHVRKRVLVDDDPAPGGELRVKTRMAKTGKSRRGSEWIVGWNSDYQIVPDKLFQAVVMARGFRPSDGKNRRIKADGEDLFKHPICDCPGRIATKSS